MLLYELESLKEDNVRKNALSNLVDSLKARLSSSQTLCNARPLRIPGFYCWRLRDQYRLIGKLERIAVDGKNEEVLFLTDLLHRSDNLYLELTRANTIQNARIILRAPKDIEPVADSIRFPEALAASEDEQLRVISEALNGKQPEVYIPPELPELWNSYLYSNWLSAQSECPIFESRDYRSKASVFNDEQLECLHDTIFQIADKADLRQSLKLAEVQTKDVDSDWVLHFVSCSAESHPQLTWEWFVFLLDLTKKESMEDMEQGDGVWNDIRANLSVAKPINVLASRAQTAYPALLLYDWKHWERMERSSSPVLALSAEEIGLLAEFRRMKTLPTLLEGRAGSGKSTMLFYFLAEAIASWRDNGLDTRRVLFVTQSDMLLKEAKENVGALSRVCEKLFLAERKGTHRFNDGPCTFLTLYELLFKLLDLRGKAGRFFERKVADCYVNIARFRRLFYGLGDDFKAKGREFQYNFRGQGQIRNISAELSWFVIRSYIKGHAVIDPEDGSILWMDPEAYSELPSGDRNVDQDVFKAVYENVWQGWYRELTTDHQGPSIFWDDQDLALSCMVAVSAKSAEAEEIYALIVCDEGQDFTPIETDVLTHFLAYRYYDMRPHHPLRLPLLVAADPFQSINPSGFRWEGVKDILNTSLQGSNTTFGLVDVRHKELEFNYRNDWHIARLANTIQACRRFLLKCRTIPQKIWKNRENDLPVGYVRFDMKDKKSVESIRARILHIDVDMIVPYREVEIIEALSLPSIESAEFIVTPIEIKGLERKSVIVAGFGDYFYRCFWGQEPFRDRWSLPENPVSFELEYFFNNLYVAVTRAREELVILDTIEGFDSFWDLLPNAVRDWTGSDPKNYDWEENCRYEYEEYDLANMEGGDPVSKAREWRDRGSENQDAADMDRAVYWFSRALRRYDEDYTLHQYDRDELIAEKNECRAWSYYFRGLKVEAATVMSDEGGNPAKAVEWLWEDLRWSELIKSIESHHRRLPPFWKDRNRLADFSLKRQKQESFSIDETRLFLDLLEKEEQSRKMDEGKGSSRSPWNQLINDFISTVANHCEKETSEKQIQLDALNFGGRMENVFSLSYEALAIIAYTVKRTDKAIRYFEYAGMSDDYRYHELLALKKKYPENLMHWESARRLDFVLHQFKENCGEDDEYQAWLKLKPEDRRRIARAMAKEKEHSREKDLKMLAYYLLLLEPQSAARHLKESLWSERLLPSDCSGLSKLVLTFTKEDPTPSSDQIQPERRTVDYIWSLSRTIFKSGDFSSDKEMRQGAATALAFSPGSQRLLENFKDERDRMALAREILPTVLTSIASIDCQDVPEKEREAYARFALELVWTVEKAEESDSGRVSTRKSEIAIPLDIFRNWPEKVIVETLVESLRAAAHVLSNLNEDRYERDTQVMVEAVAERFARLRYLKEIPDPDADTRVTIKAVKKDWRTVGRLTETSPYRLHAIQFYEAIEEMRDFKKDDVEVREALSRASARKKHRDRQKNDEKLLPGNRFEEDGISLHFFRNGLTFQITDLDEGHQCRFILDKETVLEDEAIIHNRTNKSGFSTEGSLSLVAGSSTKWSILYQWETETGKVRVQLPSGRWVKVERKEKDQAM